MVNGISYLLEDTFNFKAGKQHTLSLTINSNPDQVKIEIGGEIEDGWNYNLQLVFLKKSLNFVHRQ
ncbi:MAG: hypothetical protein ACLTSL_12085 [Odoribacter splanchnicus]